MTTAVDKQALSDLSQRISGRILVPEDPGYDEACRVHNGLIDRKPAVIVRCHDADDVSSAVRFGRDTGLDICVRGGGHNVAGRAVIDNAVMIDLAEMKGVSVDPASRTLRAEGGVTWGELNTAAAEHGLAVTGGAISTTGIAGYTLGGGLGWLMPKYGLASDNVTRIELVTAEGEQLDVGAESHADLFWALRGGGGNFGVATAFTYQLHPLATVTGGLIAHPVDAAPEMLRFYREAVASCSDELLVLAVLTHAPDGSGAKLAAMVVCHAGDAEQAEIEVAPFKDWGSPLLVEVGEMPYPVMNTLLDGGFPAGALNYWQTSFTNGLTDGLIDTAVGRFASVPSPMTGILFEHFHGAVTRIGETESAVPHRQEGWNLLITSVWTDPDTTAANIAWTRDTRAALAEHLAARQWLNYLDDDQGDNAVRAAYGPNYPRLVEVKRRYDPDNVFHHNHNIVP
jgi:FAD/FMN-containing dehydrogenase